MPDYRRAYQPGGTFFFTLVTNHRRPLFNDSANVERLRTALREVRQQWPFEPVAGVVLPDHLHFIWTLPPGESDYSKRIGRMKVLFTKSLIGTKWEVIAAAAGGSRRRHNESEVWQRRFWEHVIKDECDFAHHFDYLHYNPVKHALCDCPHQWPASSFRHWVRRDVYDPDWCCSCSRSSQIAPPYPREVDRTVGE
ncbi:MAG TPA: transposase [Tepidisphaeraceae bacterium]|jgi:putative transposase